MFKQKCLQLVMTLVERSLEDHYTKTHAERVKSIFANDAFPHLKEVPNAEVINTYVANIMQSIAQRIYEERGKTILQLIQQEVEKLIEELLTEDEAKEVYQFGCSPTGQKVFRNLDLLREAIQRGRNIMTAEIISAWSEPSVTDEIDAFIKGLNGDNDDIVC